MSIQWFPGHMAKALRDFRNHLKNVDCVIELADARIPSSSRNPLLKKPMKQSHVLVLGKSDLADGRETDRWLSFYARQGVQAAAIDARNPNDLKKVRQILIEIQSDILAKAQAKGRRIRPLRVIVAGIPNTGKSSLINGLCGRKSAQTANRPGVTRAVHWLRAGTDFELMDTPGVLWPKLETRSEQVLLAATGAIRDEILPREEVAQSILLLLEELYPEAMKTRYPGTHDVLTFLRSLDRDALAQLFAYPDDCDHHPLLDQLLARSGEYAILLSHPSSDDEQLLGLLALSLVAFEQRAIVSGGEPDLQRAAGLVLTDLRSGRLGRLTLERPDYNHG